MASVGFLTAPVATIGCLLAGVFDHRLALVASGAMRLNRARKGQKRPERCRGEYLLLSLHADVLTS
jgi:hypothetical protein